MAKKKECKNCKFYDTCIKTEILIKNRKETVITTKPDEVCKKYEVI